MKPSFALNLSHDGIGLLHRTSRGWSSVGEVALDTPEVGKAMAFLRSTALGLEPRGLSTKLILPASQVLYTIVTAPGPTTGERRAQVARALEGVTPYAVTDLAFDWSGDGPEVRVAVVAQETLQEAEHFAVEHRFHPVSFVSIPEPDQFEGEPFFGETKGATALLAGDTLEHDGEPVKIATPLPPKETDTKAAEAPEEPRETPAVETPAEAGGDDRPAATATEPPPEQPAKPEPDDRPAPPPQPLRTSVIDPVLRDEDAAPASTARPPAPEPPAATAREPALTEAAVPESPGQPAFSSRRSPDRAEAVPGPPLLGAAPGRGELPDGQAPRLRLLPEAFKAAAKGLSARAPASAAAAKPAPTPEPKPAARPQPKPKPAKPARRARPAAQPHTAAPRGAGRFLPEKPAPVSKSVRRPGRDEVIPAPPPLKPPTTEAEAMTLFGARGKPPRRLTAYLGLILTVILLAVLGAAAIWSSLYLGEAPPKTPPKTETAALRVAPAASPTPAATTQPAATAPSVVSAAPATPVAPPAPETAAQGPIATTEATLTEATASQAPAMPGSASADQASPSRPALEAAALPQNAAPEPTAATAAPRWSGPAPPDSPAEITLAAIDPAVPAAPQTGLRGAADLSHDPLPEVQSPPPASPKPAQANPAAGPQAAPATPQQAAPTVPELPPGADPALAKLRPMARPDTAPTPPPDTTATPPPDANTSPLAVATSIRPAPRPRDLTASVNAAVASAIAANKPTVASIAKPPPMQKIPSNPSVAKEATTRHGIRLNRLNLLGVFGTTSNRTAIVRLASGRVKQVKVGDRLDGGKVAAIDENSLYYVRGGRNIQLVIPKG